MEVGEKIKGQSEYLILEKIASGGMGSVLKAKMLGVEGFEKIVAIKTILSKYASNEIFVKRFVFEAKLVASLVHENIVQIYQLDKRRKEYFFVQEYVDGITLYDFMEFHKKVYDGYLSLAKRFSDRFIVIDASGEKEQTHAKIINALKEKGKNSKFDFHLKTVNQN